VCASGLTTLAWSCKVCGATVVMVPALQTPVAEVYVPWLGVAETKVRPVGSRSVTCTFVAASGTALLSVIINVMVLPTLGAALETVLATARLACCGVSVALALLFVLTGSNWSLLLMLAVFVCALA